MKLAEIAIQLREAERSARIALERGCDDDLSSLERLVAGPVRRARREIEERMLSMGALETTLRRNLLAQEAEDVALRCAQSVFANANVRFRARFSIYAAALWGAQERFLRRPLHRIALPHLELDDERSILPTCDLTLSTLDRWGDELEARLCTLLADEIRRSRELVVRRGASSLARARVLLRLDFTKNAHRQVRAG